MTQSKLPSESVKAEQPGESAKANNERKPGDIELTEEALNKISGGRPAGGSDTIFSRA
jgi:bacteriocin-like protein